MATLSLAGESPDGKTNLRSSSVNIMAHNDQEQRPRATDTAMEPRHDRGRLHCAIGTLCEESGIVRRAPNSVVNADVGSGPHPQLRDGPARISEPIGIWAHPLKEGSVHAGAHTKSES